MPVLRAVPEDFVVDEVPLYPPCGEGEHTFVRVEKRLRSTEDVARDLARAAGVAPREVGYAGRKDRAALTRQWYSVPGLAPERALRLELRGARVLEAARHAHKLRTGHLAANRFDLLVRDVPAAARARAPEAAAALAARGFANRFGPQRFGRDGANPRRALALLRGGPAGPDRRGARFLLSALQAAVFNDVLASRPLALDRLEAGDVAVVHRSGGLFTVEDAPAEQARAEAFEISATGPLFGTRMRPAAGAPGERERAALEAWEIPRPPRPPRGVRLRGGRRPLRARPMDLEVRAEDGGLRLRLALPPGSYASVFVDALLEACGAEAARVVVE